MWFMLLFASSGGIVAWIGREPRTLSVRPAPAKLSITMKLLMAIMLILILVHIVFICLEVLNRAVYPWDAWIAWIYRARAWFSAGSISAVVSSADWMAASTADTYTIAAWRYPLFPSVIPYWAAFSLGEWSETLVNLPVLFVGIAIGMALYGQCREQGFSVMISFIAAYLLFSIPLFGTHLALAGYADIWMAGYAGLGFLALIRAAINLSNTGRSGSQIWIGIFMISFSIFVKNEGAVWFLAAIVMMMLATWRPRNIVILSGSITLIVILGFFLDISHINIPLIGQLGVIEGRLVIPFIGVFPLQLHDVFSAYWNGFFKMGSWNLLWTYVMFGLLVAFSSAFLSRNNPAIRAALSFIIIFLGTQVFIFGFTNQGIWADTYTAINRLPLHFVPALLFAVAVIVQASFKYNNNSAECTNDQA
jgi:hypothetical protein